MSQQPPWQSSASYEPALPHRWQGSKLRILDQLFALLPQRDGTGRPWNRWIEPFYGCGIVAQTAAWRIHAKEYVLSDACWPLVRAHNALLSPGSRETLLKVLHLWLDRTQQEGAERLREIYAGAKFSINRADHLVEPSFFWLLATNFNGLWRVNRAGAYNVPIGKRSSGELIQPTAETFANLRVHGERLMGPWAHISLDDYSRMLTEAQQGDLVYLDPPYHNTHNAYTSRIFAGEHQVQLLKYIANAVRAGAKVFLSNADTGAYRDLLGAHLSLALINRIKIHTIKVQRSGSCKATGRGEITELLIEFP